MGLSPFHTLAPELFASPPSTHPAAKDGFMQTMPPRASLTSSFSVTDANNEVVCPLKNNDGSNCRKRCLGVSISPIFSLCVGRSIGAPLLATPAIAAVRHFYRAKRPAFHVYLSLLPYPPALKFIYEFISNVAMRLYRRSAIAPCRSISAGRIRIITFRSSRPPKRALS